MQSGLHQQAASSGVAALFAFGNGKLRLNTRQDARYELGKLLESSAKGLYLAEANSQMGKSKRKRREERERGSEGGVEEPG